MTRYQLLDKHLQHVSDSISKANSNVIDRKEVKARAMESGSQIKKSRAASSSSSQDFLTLDSLLSGFEDGAFPIRMRALSESHIYHHLDSYFEENARTFVAFTEIMLPPMLGIYGALVKTGRASLVYHPLKKSQVPPSK